MTLRVVPALAIVQLNLIPRDGSPSACVWSSWCASSSSAFRPSSGFTPAWAGLPRTVRVAAAIPLVARASSSFGAGEGSHEKTTSCCAARRVIRLRAPGVLSSSSPLISTVSIPYSRKPRSFSMANA